MFGKGFEKDLRFKAIKVEESQFSFIVTQHGLHIFVVEIVVGTIHQIRIVDFNGNGHNRNDIKCSYVINVIKYSEKENLEISPAIRVYECDWSVEQSWAQWIIVYPRLDRKFVVQMNDGAWNDFSMNLKFEELTEE